MPITRPRKAVQRWRQPGQQQGRRFPSISSVRALSIRRALVFGFFAESIQHSHSLRARGVIFSHAASAFGSEVRGLRKSGGTLCTTPEAISFLVIASPILPEISSPVQHRAHSLSIHHDRCVRLGQLRLANVAGQNVSAVVQRCFHHLPADRSLRAAVAIQPNRIEWLPHFLASSPISAMPSLMNICPAAEPAADTLAAFRHLPEQCALSDAGCLQPLPQSSHRADRTDDVQNRVVWPLPSWSCCGVSCANALLTELSSHPQDRAHMAPDAARDLP